MAGTHGLETPIKSGSHWVTTQCKFTFQCDSPMLGWFNIFMILTSRKSCKKQATQIVVSNMLVAGLLLVWMCVLLRVIFTFYTFLYKLISIYFACLCPSDLQFLICVTAKTPKSIFKVGANIYFLLMSMWVKLLEGKQTWLVMTCQQRFKQYQLKSKVWDN